MSESSPEEPEVDAVDEIVEDKPEKLVPAKAVAKERSEKRAAREEVNKLRGELAEKSKQFLSAEDLSSLMDEMAEVAKTAAEEYLKPIEAERDQYRMAAEMGLNPGQAAKVMNIKASNPNLTSQQALLLARSEDSDDLFPSQRNQVNRAAIGGLPVGGLSPARSAAPAQDFVKKMNEARDKGDVNATKKFAKDELFARVHRLFGTSPR